MYFFSIVIIVASNIFYNICQKSTPKGINPFSALLVTYVVAAACTIGASFFFKTEKGLFESLPEINWTSIVLGFAIVGLELGYLLAYRSGWNISIGSLVANIFLALMLIPVGIIMYNEAFDPSKMAGILLCIAGLILINR